MLRKPITGLSACCPRAAMGQAAAAPAKTLKNLRRFISSPEIVADTIGSCHGSKERPVNPACFGNEYPDHRPAASRSWDCRPTNNRASALDIAQVPAPRRERVQGSLLNISVEGWCAMERGVQPLPDSPVIMIAEDDEAVQAIVEEALTDGGFEVEIVASGEEALTLLQGDE